MRERVACVHCSQNAELRRSCIRRLLVHEIMFHGPCSQSRSFDGGRGEIRSPRGRLHQLSSCARRRGNRRGSRSRRRRDTVIEYRLEVSHCQMDAQGESEENQLHMESCGTLRFLFFYLSISRGTAIIALSYCDRFFLSRREISRHLFQIVSITCLFVASKIFETSPIKLVSV